MKPEDIVIGGVYRTKDGFTRIFRGDPRGFMSGRGCSPVDAIPANHYRADELSEPTLREVQNFLAKEMKYGMAQSWNR